MRVPPEERHLAAEFGPNRPESGRNATSAIFL
jgi:hypothetical protein